MTATAIMKLWELGELDLDRDINEYLPFEIRNPHYPEVPITTRILLTHRSGLAWPNGEDPDFYHIYPQNTAPPLGPWLQQYLVPEGAEYVAAMWLNTRPGQTVQYSNVGGALLGYLVEAISGQDFAAYCRENIFIPLEMPNTGFTLDDFDDRQNFATLYADNNTVVNEYSVKFYPATTLRSTLTDFSHYLITILNGGELNGKRILQEATVNEMLRLHVASAGLGLIWWNHGSGYMGHTGSFWGVSSSMDVNRTKRLGVLIFTNKANLNTVFPNGEIYNFIHAEAENY